MDQLEEGAEEGGRQHPPLLGRDGLGGAPLGTPPRQLGGSPLQEEAHPNAHLDRPVMQGK